MNRTIQFGIHKLLLYFGVKKEEIRPEAQLDTIIPHYQSEWNSFLFFLESKYDIELNEKEERNLITVESTVNTVLNRVQ